MSAANYPEVTIADRFCGPPDTGNGGYVAGLLARELLGPVEVTLLAATPLGRPLAVSRIDESLQLFDGETLVARARPVEALELDPPSAPSMERIRERERSCRAFETHPFPRCFVCGADRAAGDGLRILPGWHEAELLAAASFVPDASLADASGRIAPEFLWAALDCGGSFALLQEEETARKLEPMVLGRLTAALYDEVRPGESLAVVSWSLGLEGRRGLAGTALLRESGEVVGGSKAVWVSIQSR